MATTRIRYGDEGYDALHAAWVTNGRPSGTFDRSGFWGGALYRIRTPEGVEYDGNSHPDFFMITSMGPTVVDDDTGKVTQEGWHLANQEDGFSVKVKVKDDAAAGAPLIEIDHKDPPQNLTVAESVEEE